MAELIQPKIYLNLREMGYHSTTLETWMAQVGSERALEGSLSGKEEPNNGNSAADTGPTRVRANPAPKRAAMAFLF